MHAPQHVSFPHVQAHASRVRRDGATFFEVNATAFTRAAPQQAWAVLTDYDRLADFVPDLLESRVVSRHATEAIVEQHSAPGFLFVSQSIRLRLRVVEQPVTEIDVALIEGDMQHYAAHWALEPERLGGIDGTRVSFRGAMEPDFFVPPLVGRPIVQAQVRKMVEAVMVEIERRSMH